MTTIKELADSYKFLRNKMIPMLFIQVANDKKHVQLASSIDLLTTFFCHFSIMLAQP